MPFAFTDLGLAASGSINDPHLGNRHVILIGVDHVDFLTLFLRHFLIWEVIQYAGRPVQNKSVRDQGIE